MKKALSAALVPVAFAAAFVFAATVALAQQDGGTLSIEDKIIQEKCSFCHNSKRIFTMDPSALKPTLERMQKMNPDWITDIERDHVAEVLVKILGSSSGLAVRQAWQEAVARGEALFGNAALGGDKGASCVTCHAPESLAKVHDAYPQYQLPGKRFISLEDKINEMIIEKMKGQALPRQDQRMVDLIAYLKSL